MPGTSARPKDKAKGEGDGEAPTKVCPACQSINALPARVCVDCGYAFPARETHLEATATTRPILSTGRLEWVGVSAVTYHRHEKPGKPPSLRVDYHCGLVRHREWVCLEHGGYAGRKAAQWWLRRAEADLPPATVEEALTRADELRTPVEIAVRPNGRFTEVVHARFT
jgi:DNA repair protein RadD